MSLVVLASVRTAAVRSHRQHLCESHAVHALPGTRSFTADALSLSRSVTRPASLDPYPTSSFSLRMIMFGKPGAGKGTLTSRLVDKYDVVSLSSGDLLRQHIVQRTEVGKVAKEIVATGGLLPDNIMLKVVTTKLDELRSKHWILDGFPRTVGQGEQLDIHLQEQNIPLSLIVNLDVDDQVILSRISERWVHLPSGRVYNMSYNRPKATGQDDVTGEPLTKRPDDNPEIFSQRLKQYYASTEPLIEYFASQPTSRTKLVSLKGKTSDEIWPQLDDVVRGLFPSLQERVPTSKTKTEGVKAAGVKAAVMDGSVSARPPAQNGKSWVPPL